MKEMSISEARRRLPALIAEVASSGTPLIITRRGRALAKLVPVEQAGRDERSLPLRGVPIRVAEDFDEPLDDHWEAGQP